MSTTAGKREPHSKATTRADRLRPLNLPQPVKVELDDAGLPSVVADSYCSASLPLCNPGNHEGRSEAIESSVAGKAVESIIEVWHIDDEWWRDTISRRYVEVILDGGKHVILYEDLTTNDWFKQMP